MTEPLSAAEKWRVFKSEFDALAQRQSDLKNEGGRNSGVLRAYCSYGPEHPVLGHIRIEGGPTQRIVCEFEEIGTRAGVALACPVTASRPVDFWVHSLCQDLIRTDSSELFYGSAAGGVIEDLLASSASYCLRLATSAAESSHKNRAFADISSNPRPEAPRVDAESLIRPTSEDTVFITDDQRRKIAEIEDRLGDSFRAHEMMRGVNQPGDWIRGSAPAPGTPTTTGDFRRLETDITEGAIALLRIMAQALWKREDADFLRERLTTYALHIREHLIARIDPRDVPFFDQPSFESEINSELESWIRRARAAFPPPWMRDTPVTGAGQNSATALTASNSELSWTDLQREFLQYAAEHADLAAIYSWRYTHADQAANRPPQGQWMFRGGRPGSHHLFKTIAENAARRLQNGPATEPWCLWLNTMREEGYTTKVPRRRVSWREFKNAVESSEYLPLPRGFESQQIENVFKASAEFCYVRSISVIAPAAPKTVPEVSEESTVRSNGAPENQSAEAGAANELSNGDSPNRRRGRRADNERRDCIARAIQKRGDKWREYLSDILQELDTDQVDLGDFRGMRIDLGDGDSILVKTWGDLDYAEGDERRKIIDALRKYVPPLGSKSEVRN